MAEPIKNYGLIGSSEPDNLINQTSPSALTTGVEVKPSQGVLKRGTAVGYAELTGVLDTTGVIKVIEETRAFYILAADVDTGTSGLTTAVVYSAGHFNRNIVNDVTGTTLTFDHENELREKGIFLSDAKE